MQKPNIFAIATKELSQDAFITWLIQWADQQYSENEDGLYKIGQSFVSFLLSKKIDVTNLEIQKVEAGRQWDNIDIWAEVNERFFIIIEDKTETSEHDNQLDRYSKQVSDLYGSSREIVPIYLKTGLEDIYIGKGIQEKGWSYCDRNDLLSFLSSHETTNDIYNDFVSHLKQKDAESKSFVQYRQLNSWEASKGLFVWLQQQIQEWTQWGYVSNPSGGFLGFWFHFVPCEANEKREFYLQIENSCCNKCNLFIKISGEWSHDSRYLYSKLHYLNEIEHKYNLSISKPSRFRPGEYTSLAVIKNSFKNDNGKLDLENLLNKIKNACSLVDELAKNS